MDVSEFLDKRRKLSLVALGTLALVLVGTVDYFAVGQLLEFSIFFLLPVSFFTWFVNGRLDLLCRPPARRSSWASILLLQSMRRIHESATGMRLSGWGFSC